jgi:hypothetical protein
MKLHNKRSAAMLYPKNVPNIERVARIGLGLILVALAFSGQSLLGIPSPILTIILLFSAVFVAVTGFVGWCPACALVGRKIKLHQPKVK